MSYPKLKCPFTSKTHMLYKSGQLCGIAAANRSEFVKKNKVCERCLNSGHATKYCNLKYMKCKKQNYDARENHNTAKAFGKYFDPFVLEIVYGNVLVNNCLVSVANEKQAANATKGRFKLKKLMLSSEAVLRLILKEDKSTII